MASQERQEFNTKSSRSQISRSWTIYAWVVVGVASIGLNVYQYTSRQAHARPLDMDQAFSETGWDLASPRPWDLGTSRSPRSLATANTTNTTANGSTGNHSSATTAHGSAGSAHGGHSGPHQHDALLFMFNAIVIGVLISHIKYLKIFHSMQETVALFCVGVVYSLVQNGLNVKDDMGVFGQSYSMWMEIDPHLLLFTLLPALLTGDAMTIDTSVAKRVGLQCLYLAGPGVLINAMLVAVFLQYYFDWEFLLCLVTGSILCATDPVAVVALLKELGASPVLTIQIQGESLLNDGTAIVLFSIAYRMLQGEVFDVSDCIMFLITVALMAWALGMVIGFFFYVWIRAADNKLQHSAEIIQITLTLAAGYWSFIIAEGVFHISGVLACVASALTLAHFMWPHVVCPTSMHHVWHMLETLGNTIIFFLAGALTGKVMVEIEAIDYLHLLVIYLILLIVRGGLIFLSRPILKILSKDKQPVTKAEAAVMTWGGLRGAVGLALAIQVHNDRAPDENGAPQISPEQANRVLFYVGGIAFLTTIINATTCPALVTWLGITAQSEAKVNLMKIMHDSLVLNSHKEEHPDGVINSLDNVLHHIEDHISHAKTRNTGKARSATAEPEGALLGDNIKDFHQAREVYLTLPKDDLKLCGYDDETNKNINDMIKEAAKREPMLLDLVGKAGEKVDWDMSRVFNEAFLNLVRASYWRQISKRVLPPGSDEADVLLHSVQMGLSYPRANLFDFSYIFHSTLKSSTGFPTIARDDEIISKFRSMTNMMQTQQEPPPKFALGPAPVVAFVKSVGFNFVVAAAILLNGIYIAVEETRRSPSDQGKGWLVIESLFTFTFVAEAIVKLTAFRCGYWMDSWNVFDFVLALCGVIGCLADYSASDYDANTATGGQSRLIRMTRVLKVARLLRLFRLFKMVSILLAKLDKHAFSVENGEHFKKFTSLTAFVKGHLHAQRDMMELLCPAWRQGGGGGPRKGDDDCSDDEPDCVPAAASQGKNGAMMTVEMANCLLESQASIYMATALSARAVNQMNCKDTLEHITQVRQSQDIVEELEEMVLDAQTKGVISSRDAEAITHPLHHHIENCQHLISKTLQGFEMCEELKEELMSHGQSDGHHEPHGGKHHGGEAASSSSDVTPVLDIIQSPVASPQRACSDVTPLAAPEMPNTILA